MFVCQKVENVHGEHRSASFLGIFITEVAQYSVLEVASCRMTGDQISYKCHVIQCSIYGEQMSCACVCLCIFIVCIVCVCVYMSICRVSMALINAEVFCV